MKILAFVAAVTCTLATAGWFLFGSNFGSVLDTAFARTRTEMNLKLGEDFRLDQATMELKNADQEIVEQQRRVAELRVSCDELKDEVQTLSARHKQQVKMFHALDDALSRSGNGTRPVAFRSQMVDPNALNTEIQSCSMQVKTTTQRLEVRKQLLKTRLAALDQASGFLSDIKKRRDRVQLAIETSRIDLESVRLLQQASGTDIDASALASAENLAREVSRELRIQRETTNLATEGRIPNSLMDTAPSMVVDEVRQMLRNESDAPTSANMSDLAFNN